MSDRIRLLSAIISGLIFWAISGQAQAATYYVSPNGNDNNPGTLAQPWATFSYANNRVVAGDIVFARGGTYRQFFTITKSNTTWQAYPGETPLLDGDWSYPTAGTVPDYTAMITINGCTGVVLDGFHVAESTGTGIKIYANNDDTHHITVRNCKADGAFYGSLHLSTVRDVLIEDSEFARGGYVVALKCNYDLSRCRTQPPYWMDTANVYTPSCRNIIFRRTTIRDGYNEGLNLEANSDNITLDTCKIYGNNKIQLYIVSSNNHTVKNCLIYGTNPNANGNDATTGPGIWISSETGWSQTLIENFNIYGNFVANNSTNFDVATQDANTTIRNVNVYNNTFVSAYRWNVSISNAVNSNFKNNIVYGGGSMGLAYLNGSISSDNNLWSAQPAYAGLRGAHDPTYAVPLLSKTTGWNSLSGGGLSFNDFKLQTGSPGINAGTALGSPYNIDYFGTTRPQGSAWDIGAHEYATASNPTDTTAPAVPSGLAVR